MKELVLTHLVNGIANIAIVDYVDSTVVVKRVPAESVMLKALLASNKIRKCYSEVSDTQDVWLFKTKEGWVSVSCDGFISITQESNRLETDDSAFLTAFVELPVWSDKSKVFVAKLLHTGYKVNLRPYIKIVDKLSPDVASAFARMRAVLPSERVEVVSRIEMWGHTLNTLYKSNMELLDISLLGELNWLPPLVCTDSVLWRGMTAAHDRTLYVYLKGDTVLYVGYENLREVEINRYTTEIREVQEVLTYNNLITSSCIGLLEVRVSYLMWDASGRNVKVCNERLRDEAECNFSDFLFDSMVLISVLYEILPNGSQVQKSFLYDVVNNKIYVFKSYESDKLGTYYGEMTVDEWRERKENYIGTE